MRPSSSERHLSDLTTSRGSIDRTNGCQYVLVFYRPPLGGMIMSFDPTFARTVMLPFVRAAYAVTADPTHEPQLPDGFTQTALLQADMNLVTELLKDLGDMTAPVLRAMTAPGSVYGLMGQNTQTQTAFVAFRAPSTSRNGWLTSMPLPSRTSRCRISATSTRGFRPSTRRSATV